MSTISRLRSHFRFLKSLKFRIFVAFILFGIIPGFVLKYGIMDTYEDRAISQKGIEVQNQCTILAKQILATGYMEDPTIEVIDGEMSQLSNLYDGRFIIIDDDFRIIKDTYVLEETKTIVAEEVTRAFKGVETTNYDGKNQYVEITVPIMNETEDEVVGVILASVSTDAIVTTLELLSQKSNILLIAMAVIVTGIALFSSIQLIRPFNHISRAIEEFSQGYQYEDESISIPDYTETQSISEAFNKLLARMKLLDDSRQEFVSNVSHELKTPITSMKVLADSLLMQDEVPAELYKEFLADIAEEIDRESKIINDLLALVKMDKTASDLNITMVNINELVELILKRLRPIAEKQNIELVFESFRPVNAEIDEVKLTLAISNLVENAIKYNIENGWVRVSLNADHKFFYIKVTDSGIGIPEDALEHIFERFYRVDKSHSREIGGTGLGLSITRGAILKHRGAIKVYSKENEGTTFTVRVPLNYIA